MPAEVLTGSTAPESLELMGQLITNCGRPTSASAASTRPTSASASAASRLVAFVDRDSAGEVLPTVRGSLEEGPAPTRLSFDMLGVTGLNEGMLRELYEAFDIHQRGGVTRGVMREVLRSGFSNYGAPCGAKDINRLFEHATPFQVRRQLRGEGNEDEEVMPFNEFCVLFLAWLRL